MYFYVLLCLDYLNSLYTFDEFNYSHNVFQYQYILSHVKVVPQLTNCFIIFRLGVAACGCEDKNVEKLSNTLSAFLWHETTTRAGLPLQIAIVTALLGLISVDLGQVIEINSMCPSIASQSAVAGAIRKWFSSLSKEHQALSFSLFQSSALGPNVR